MNDSLYDSCALCVHDEKRLESIEAVWAELRQDNPPPEILLSPLFRAYLSRHWSVLQSN